MAQSEFTQNREYQSRQPSGDELVKKTYFENRFTDMRQFRTTVDKNW